MKKPTECTRWKNGDAVREADLTGIMAMTADINLIVVPGKNGFKAVMESSSGWERVSADRAI